MPSALSQFVGRAEEAVRFSTDESEILRRLRPMMKELLSNPSLTEAAFKERKDRFAMNLVYMPEDRIFSVSGGVWLPGQTTPIHDHLTWAIVGLCKGEERESIFKRTDDGSDPKVARLDKVSERINREGHITTLGRSGIHRIDNISNSPSTSIHVYGIDIGNLERHAYDPVTGEISKFVSGYCNVLRDEDLA